MRTIAPPVGRGWEYLAGDGYDWDAELDRAPRPARARSSPRRRSRPARYDLVIHPSNLWLTIHESIGHATELDRALGYEANYAGTSFATYRQARHAAVRLARHARHRRPHRRARPGHDRVRRRGRRRPSSGTSSGTASSSATSSTGRWRTCTAPSSTAAAPTAAPTPTPPATSRSSGWPTSRCSRRPTGPTPTELIGRVERGIYVVGDKSWSIDMQRYNFQFTGQRFYRIEDGELAGQLRDVAYQATTTDFWGSMEAVGGPADLGARRRVQLRQGPARPGRAGQPRLPDLAVPRRQRSSTPPTRAGRCTDDRAASPQELVEHALDASTRPTHCVVIVARLHQRQPALGQQHPDHQRRDARRRRHRGRRSHGTGEGTPPASVTGSAALDRAGRPRSSRRPTRRPARPARRGRRRAGRPATAAADWDDAPGRDLDRRLRRLRAGARRGVRAGRAPSDRILYGFVDHDVTTTYLGTSHRPAAAPRPADRALRLHRQDRRPVDQRLGRRRHPRLRRRRRARDGRRARAAARLGRAARRPRRPAATTRSCRRPRSPT